MDWKDFRYFLLSILHYSYISRLNNNLTKWSNNSSANCKSRTNCLIVFDHFVRLAQKKVRQLGILTGCWALHSCWNLFFVIHSMKLKFEWLVSDEANVWLFSLFSTLISSSYPKKSYFGIILKNSSELSVSEILFSQVT